MTIEEQIKYFSFIVETDDPLGKESAAMHREILKTLKRYSYLRSIARPISKRPDIFSGPITLNVESPFFTSDTWGPRVDAAIDAALSPPNSVTR
jgi:hypothetical protein